jgi:hypothetical protein
MEPFVFISHARISLQHLSARSGSFLNISNGDAVQMKYILNLLLVPLDPLTEEDIDLIEYDDEEEIELEETSADTEESSCLSLFDFYFYSQISGSFFPSKVNDTFLESDEEKSFLFYAECLIDYKSLIKIKSLEDSLSDFYFNEKVKILTEKKRLQDMADHKKELKEINHERNKEKEREISSPDYWKIFTKHFPLGRYG